jgi:hypothetical protein
MMCAIPNKPETYSLRYVSLRSDGSSIDDQEVAAHATQWAAFYNIDIDPSGEDCAFVARFGVTRKRQGQTEAIARTIESSKGEHVAIFEHRRQLGSYICCITVLGIKLGSFWENLKPALNTRITLDVTILGAVLQYYGVVCEDSTGEISEDREDVWDCTAVFSEPDHNFGAKSTR